MRGRARLVALLLAAVALLGLTALWVLTRSIDPAEHAGYERRLTALRQVDRTTNQDVLRARFQLVHNYDTLVRARDEAASLRRSLRSMPSFLSAPDRHMLAVVLDSYDSVLDRKTELVETFKSRASVLRTSLSYLPTVAHDLIEAERAARGGAVLVDPTQRLLDEVLVYNLTFDETRTTGMLADLDALVAHAATVPTLAESRSLRNFEHHVRSILAAKPALDRIVGELFALPVIEAEERTFAAYHAGRAHAEMRAGRYRTLLYGLAVLLGVAVVVAFLRLDKARRALADSNKTLEARVANRTAALAHKNDEMRLVFDNVAQGFFTVGRDGMVRGERAAIIDRWIPGLPKTTTVWDLVDRLDGRAGAWLRVGFRDLFEDVLPFEVVADQLPKTLATPRGVFALEYQRIAGDDDRVLLVLTDRSAEAERERAERRNRDLLRVLEQMMHDRFAFEDFLTEGNAIVDRVAIGSDPLESARDVHTLKGNASLVGLTGIASLCHDIEERSSPHEGVEPADRARLAKAWGELVTDLEPLLGNEIRHLDVTRTDLEAIRRRLAHGATKDELDEMLVALFDEHVEGRLTRLGEQARALAHRLGREVQLDIDARGVRLDPARFAPLWTALAHVVRNAVDHGVETPEERLAQGKSRAGLLTLETRVEGDDIVVIALTDDGRGIDWVTLEARARARGLRVEGHEALFIDGLSSRDEANEISGRGLGMSAVRSAVEALGGRVVVESERGHGTAVMCSIPMHPVATRLRTTGVIKRPSPRAS